MLQPVRVPSLPALTPSVHWSADELLDCVRKHNRQALRYSRGSKLPTVGRAIRLTFGVAAYDLIPLEFAVLLPKFAPLNSTRVDVTYTPQDDAETVSLTLALAGTETLTQSGVPIRLLIAVSNLLAHLPVRQATSDMSIVDETQPKEKEVR